MILENMLLLTSLNILKTEPGGNGCMYKKSDSV